MVPGTEGLGGAHWIGDEKVLYIWENVIVFDTKNQSRSKWEFEP